MAIAAAITKAISNASAPQAPYGEAGWNEGGCDCKIKHGQEQQHSWRKRCGHTEIAQCLAQSHRVDKFSGAGEKKHGSQQEPGGQQS